jgi:hypothetical protein
MRLSPEVKKGPCATVIHNVDGSWETSELWNLSSNNQLSEVRIFNGTHGPAQAFPIFKHIYPFSTHQRSRPFGCPRPFDTLLPFTILTVFLLFGWLASSKVFFSGCTSDQHACFRFLLYVRVLTVAVIQLNQSLYRERSREPFGGGRLDRAPVALPHQHHGHSLAYKIPIQRER